MGANRPSISAMFWVNELRINAWPSLQSRLIRLETSLEASNQIRDTNFTELEGRLESLERQSSKDRDDDRSLIAGLEDRVERIEASMTEQIKRMEDEHARTQSELRQTLTQEIGKARELGKSLRAELEQIAAAQTANENTLAANRTSNKALEEGLNTCRADLKQQASINEALKASNMKLLEELATQIDKHNSLVVEFRKHEQTMRRLREDSHISVPLPYAASGSRPHNDLSDQVAPQIATYLPASIHGPPGGTALQRRRCLHSQEGKHRPAPQAEVQTRRLDARGQFNNERRETQPDSQQHDCTLSTDRLTDDIAHGQPRPPTPRTLFGMGPLQSVRRLVAPRTGPERSSSPLSTLSTISVSPQPPLKKPGQPTSEHVPTEAFARSSVMPSTPAKKRPEPASKKAKGGGVRQRAAAQVPAQAWEDQQPQQKPKRMVTELKSPWMIPIRVSESGHRRSGRHNIEHTVRLISEVTKNKDVNNDVTGSGHPSTSTQQQGLPLPPPKPTSSIRQKKRPRPAIDNAEDPVQQDLLPRRAHAYRRARRT